MSSVFNICGGENNSFTPAPRKIVPQGTLEITENGEYDVTQYAEALVAVAGGGGAEIERGEWTPTRSVDDFVPFANEHDKPPCIVVATIPYSEDFEPVVNYILHYSFIDNYQLFGDGFFSQNSERYSVINEIYCSNTTTGATSSGQIKTLYSSDDLDDGTSDSSRYWVTENGFYGRVIGTRRFHDDQTYKWIAIWLP